MSLDLYGVGNALVDLVFGVEDDVVSNMGLEKGIMTLASLSHQNHLLEELGDTSVLRQSGGSAANTLAAVGHMGLSCHYACRVANDELGQLFLKDLKEAGVETHKAIYTGSRAGKTGFCIVLVSPDGERTLRTYLGVTAHLSPTDVHEDILAKARMVYAEGYLMTSEQGYRTLIHTKKLARKHGVKFVLSLSDPEVVDRNLGRFEDLLDHEDGIDILLGNGDEFKCLTRSSALSKACRYLEPKVSSMAITLGSEGSWVVGNGKIFAIPAGPARVVDTNGAGDIYAAGFMYSILSGSNIYQAGSFASRLSSKLVSVWGPRLSKKELQNLS
ncbi:MAG: adenosine kinase [Cytophagales bacterium]|nr:adenosine kinase [Cytophagales bacterium]